MPRTEENGTRSEYHRILVIRRMLHHLRGSTHRIEDRDIDLRRRIMISCGVVLGEEVITEGIFHNIKVVGLR